MTEQAKVRRIAEGVNARGLIGCTKCGARRENQGLDQPEASEPVGEQEGASDET